MSEVPSTNPFAAPYTENSEETSARTGLCNCTASKVAKVSAFVFIICALVVTTAALCMNYPSAPAVAYSLFGAVGTLALIAMITSTAKTCLAQRS